MAQVTAYLPADALETAATGWPNSLVDITMDSTAYCSGGRCVAERTAA